MAADASQLHAAAAEPHRGHRPEVIAAVLGCVAGAVLVLAVQGLMPPPPAPPPAAAAAPPPAAEVVPPAPPAAAPRPAVHAPEVAVAPPPREAAAKPAVKPATPRGTTIDIWMDRPEGTMLLSKSALLEPGATVVVRGRIKTLHVSGAEIGAAIDASGLAAERISIGGSVTGGSVLKLNAPNGQVSFTGSVSGRSTVHVHAPGGEVLFNASTSNVIDGARVTVTAAKVRCKGEVSGTGTRLEATLANGGGITIRSLRDRAVVEYRKGNPGDAAPSIDIGFQDPTAACRRVE